MSRTRDARKAFGALPWAVAAALSVLPACRNARSAPVDEAQERPKLESLRVETGVVVERTLADQLEVTGTLRADQTAEVASERDGRLVEVKIERGSYVDKGAVIAVIDSQDAKATLADAEASLAWTTSEKGRYEDLRRKGVISASELQRRQLDVQSAQAKVDIARKALDDCIIRAPFSGLVTEKMLSEGAYVKRGQGVAGLVSVDPLRAELAIPEINVSRVRVGQPVSVKVEAFPERGFEGRIAYVGPSLRQDARTLVVEAVINNPERVLRPGLFAVARISLPATRVAALAPANAVLTVAGVSRAFVVKDGRIVERVVALGRQEGELVEIRSGLAAGETVVVKPDAKVVDGAPVAS